MQKMGNPPNVIRSTPPGPINLTINMRRTSVPLLHSYLFHISRRFTPSFISIDPRALSHTVHTTTIGQRQGRRMASIIHQGLDKEGDGLSHFVANGVYNLHIQYSRPSDPKRRGRGRMGEMMPVEGWMKPPSFDHDSVRTVQDREPFIEEQNEA